VELTACVLTVNAALTEPVGTVTWLGGVKLGLLLDTVTVVPPLGAGVLRVTVQVTVPPPGKLAGLHASADTFACVTGPGFKLSEKFCDVPFHVAVNSA
jgi:hypothetical protein